MDILNYEQEILLIFAGVTKFTDKKTGEVVEMTEIIYGLPIEKDKLHCGYGVLKCYRKGNVTDECFLHVGRRVKATITATPDANSNHVKYSLTKLNGKDI